MSYLVADISEFQGDVDFKKLKQKVDGVIIRMGFTGYNSFTPTADARFEEYYRKATDAGLDIGVYYFTLACSEADAEREARWCIEHLLGKHLTFPVFIDAEEQSHHEGWTNLDKETRSKAVAKWCQVMESAGYYAGIYASLNWLKNKLDPETVRSYDKWVAQYYTECTYTGQYHMWQYTSTENGADFGVSSTHIDLSHCYIDFPALIKNRGLNGWPGTGYTPRLVAPSEDNKYYIKTTHGGLNKCIQIREDGSVLPNCVGYAWGRFCEAAKLDDCKLSRQNAENWWAWNDGYERDFEPHLGAVMCWRKGEAGVSEDGAGHVAIVEKIEGNTITVSQSCFGGARWGLATYEKGKYDRGNLIWQGFIINPYVMDAKPEEHKPDIKPEPVAPSTDIVAKEGGVIEYCGYYYMFSWGIAAGIAEYGKYRVLKVKPGAKYQVLLQGLGWVPYDNLEE